MGRSVSSTLSTDAPVPWTAPTNVPAGTSESMKTSARQPLNSTPVTPSVPLSASETLSRSNGPAMTTTLYPILSILKMTGLVPSEQQAIITRWSSIHPLMMDPPWRPAHMYLEIESHSSEQNGIFGPPATLSRIPRCLHQSVETASPERVLVVVTLEDEFVTHVVAWTRPSLRILAVFPLKLRIQLLVDDGQPHFVKHNTHR